MANPYPIYYRRWVDQVEIFICFIEIDDLQRSMETAFEELYKEDRKGDKIPSFENLHRGYLFFQLKNILLALPSQKRFQNSPEAKTLKVKFPLALLSCLYDVIVYSRIPELIRLQGNIETVLASYGYAFEDQEPVSELDAHIEDHYRFESEINEFKQKYLK